MVISELKGIVQRWKSFSKHKGDIPSILQTTPPATDSLEAKMAWFHDLVEWLSRRNSDHIGVVRIRFLLQILDRNPEIRQKFGEALRDLFQNASKERLFLFTGSYRRFGFWEEIFHRIGHRLLPQPTNNSDLEEILRLNFTHRSNMIWANDLDADLFNQCWQTIFGEKYQLQTETHQLFERAIKNLCISIAAQGLALVEQRSTFKPLNANVFYELSKASANFSGTDLASIQVLTTCLMDIKLWVRQLIDEFDDYGVSLAQVYTSDALVHHADRALLFANVLMKAPDVPSSLLALLRGLLSDAIKKRSLFECLNNGVRMVSRKIVESNSLTAHHYIGRTKDERTLVRQSAFGGGVITSLTVILKILISQLGTHFFVGVLYALNYAASFLAIYFAHFSLATKQPALTATVLARKVALGKRQNNFHELYEESKHLLISQLLSVWGNLLGVIPASIIVFTLIRWLSGAVMTPEKALHILDSFQLIGPTPIFAVITGFWLWLSSHVGGWAQNWFNFHQQFEAISQNRRLQFVFGARGATRIAAFTKKHWGGVINNISLGIFLGLFPILFQFVGIPLDIRHVTLSAGAIVMACLKLGTGVFALPSFYGAILGLVSMAIGNIFAAFVLSLWLALRSLEVDVSETKLVKDFILNKIESRKDVA